MSALAQSTNTIAQPTDITKISANARIDYILRFSKQAILVIDEQPSQYSQVGSEFLADLPTEQNAAFVSVSPKLNDIQLRCRIVEQLFGSHLFDPEQSLAVSVYNLAQGKTEPISIVIEHCHLLSLQLFHELCQLAEIAKKSKLSINVVLLGAVSAGQLVAEHSSLFENKITILSAENGQLIPLSSKLLKVSYSLFQLSPPAKIFLSVAVVTFILIAIVIGLYQRDVLNFSALPTQENMPKLTQLDSATVNSSRATALASKTFEVNNTDSNTIASSENIFNALTGVTELQAVVEQPQPATPNDILNAISGSTEDQSINALSVSDNQVIEPIVAADPENNSDTAIGVQEEVLSTTPETVEQLTNKNSEINRIDANYYLAQPAGYVIQYAGFREQRGYQAFITVNENLPHMAYQRVLAENPLIVVTSLTFTNRGDAEQALTELPEALRARGVWIKSVNIVKDEINLYQSSQ